ncbi:histidine kinase [Maribacter sp.]|nr:histidine kinase [Maribacter sp.]
MDSFKFNRTDYQLMIMYFVISTLWLSFRYTVEAYTNFEIITGLIGFNLKTISLLYMITWLLRNYIVTQKKYLLFFFLTFSVLGLVGFLDLLRDYFTADPPWQWNPSLSAIVVNSFYNSTPDVALPFGLILGKKYYENKLEFVQLQAVQKEMELKVLRSQFDPHFLYNSLNTIDSLIDYSPKEKVKKYISHLALLYRYLIHNEKQDVVTLEDEIGLAENYFYLIETRFEDDYCFKLTRRVDQGVKYLPNGALLTVLENVVKHNKVLEGATIQTEISVEENYVTVQNDKLSESENDSNLGTGLKNLDKRYRLLSDKKIEVTETKTEFIVRLPLLNAID